MAILATRVSDAQFSLEERDQIHRLAREMRSVTCPRCGDPLQWFAQGESARPRPVLHFGRCARCRRFVILRGEGKK